jgi:hydrogenase-4 component F
MFTWLPETYVAAPPAVTALLAAVQFNVALAGVLRILQVFRAGEPHLVSVELLVLGLTTMAMSALGIIVTRNYRRLISYASLNHGGVIAIGLALGKGAGYGVILYVVSNAIVKAILFLTAGKIRSHYKTDDVREIAGLIKGMPYSGLFFTIGTFALLGLPPFGSFLGELIILSELIRSGYLVVFTTFGAILTVTFVATGRSIFPMIWGEPKKEVPVLRQPFAVAVPKLTLIAFLIAMGLYLPSPINTLFRQVAASLGGGQ